MESRILLGIIIVTGIGHLLFLGAELYEIHNTAMAFNSNCWVPSGNFFVAEMECIYKQLIVNITQ